MTTTPIEKSYEETSISSTAFWAATAEEREATFGRLRAESPVSWHPPLEGTITTPQRAGIWAVARHADVAAVSKDWRTFSSASGSMIEEMAPEVLGPAESFLAMDAPQHTRLRRLVSSAFTPRQVAKIDQQIKDQARLVVDELLDVGDCDFVDQVSKRLPMWTIYEMLGLPPEQRTAGAHAADSVVAWADPNVAAGRTPAEVINEALTTQLNLGHQLAAARRAAPADDLMTNLVQAEVDGENLTDDEIASFFNLLAVAGNDTTRNTTSFAMKALCDFPKQRRILADDFDDRIGVAIEEFVRWTTPVMTFRRTVTTDVELHGRQLRAGEWVVLLYSSANRDERVFDAPHVFDVRRQRNPHVSFGGGGPHFCLGNMLAKTQMRALFGELLRRAPRLEVGEPTYLAGNFVRGIKTMPCSVGRPA